MMQILFESAVDAFQEFLQSVLTQYNLIKSQMLTFMIFILIVSSFGKVVHDFKTILS